MAMVMVHDELQYVLLTQLHLTRGKPEYTDFSRWWLRMETSMMLYKAKSFYAYATLRENEQSHGWKESRE